MDRWYIDSQGNPYTGDRQGFDEGILPRPDDGNPYTYNKETKEWEAQILESSAEINSKSTLSESVSVTQEMVDTFEGATTILGLKAALRPLLGITKAEQ